MRVLHVLPQISSRIGGPAMNVVASSLALREHGIHTTIVSTDMAGAVSAREHNRLNPSDLPPGADQLDLRIVRARWPQRLAFAPEMLPVLDREIRRCDVVHIHMLFMFPQWAAYSAAMRQGVPYIVSPCGALDPHLRGRSRIAKLAVDVAWQRRMLDGAAAIHFKTPEEAAAAADFGFAAPSVVVPNGVSMDEFADMPSTRTFRDGHLGGFAGPVVLHLGRLSHKKGLDILIRAFALATGADCNALLVLAGPDDENLRPRLEAIARNEGVAERVVFTGMLRGRERIEALAAADVFALPSHGENFGVAVVEALAAGTPSIISPQVNIAARIAEGRAGIVTPNTVGAVADALRTLWADGDLRRSLSAAARLHARRYDWPAVAPQLASMYRDVAKQHRGDMEYAHAA